MRWFARSLVVGISFLVVSMALRTTWAQEPAPDREGAAQSIAPEVADARVLAAARAVLTDPGDLPRLQVTVDGKKQDLPLKHTNVSAEISGLVARVEVTQTYRNPMDKPIEAIYVFPLPENSAVDDMKIRIGERLIEADIKRRDDARKTYEDAKRDGYTAALLEQERPNVFTQSIANMEPGVDIEVIIRYVQDLTIDSGEEEFVFPMVVGPRFIPGNATGASGPGWSPDTDEVPDASRITPPIVGGGMRSGHDISIQVVIDPGLPVIDLDVPTHDVNLVETDGAMVVTLSPKDSLPNRDFVMRFRTDGPETSGAVLAHKDKRGGFFSLVVQPPALDVDELLGRREVVFVIDVSGSMSGVPLAMAKDAAREAIRRLRPVDTFNVITFAGQTARAFAVSRPANTTNVREALSFVDAAMAGGGTYLANAVDEALSPTVADGRNRTVVFLTDGYVGNEASILGQVQAFIDAHEADGRSARAFGLGVGSSVNRYLLDGIGKAGRGATVILTNREDPVRAVGTIYRMIDHPILTDVKVSWGGLAVKDVMPVVLPDLVASRPLVLHGRYAKGGVGTVVVSGVANGRRVKVEVPVTLPNNEPRGAVLETLWARARIEALERSLWDGPNDKAVETITSLGLDYRLVTAYTSFVAVDRSKKVGDGHSTTIVQPVDAPEDVDPAMAAPVGVLSGKAAVMSGGGYGVGHGLGGLGFKGTGKGGGGTAAAGVGYGRAMKLSAKKVVRPTVRVATATVTGYVSKDVIQKVIRKSQPRIKRCYELSLRTNPKLAGKLTVAFTIDVQGKVKLATIEGDSAGDEALAECLLDVIRALVFPKQESEVRITYPFMFALPD